MIALYKTQRNKANTTRWGLDTSSHDQIGDNTYRKTILEVLLLKYSFFCDFEEIMRNSTIITPLFLKESSHPNYKVEVIKTSSHNDNIWNLNTQQCNSQITGDKRVGLSSQRKESDQQPSQSF